AFAPPPKVASAVLHARFRDAPRADVEDPEGFERFLHRAFARRRRTLENNLEDSYPNLKEYFRFLDIQGSRRPETLSVVEFAGIWRAVRSDPAGARG
ncbi:MAG TPA: rRNA adenine N-6-methyltransferase family protein, partial [Vicinamibacteria bacterium]